MKALVTASLLCTLVAGVFAFTKVTVVAQEAAPVPALQLEQSSPVTPSQATVVAQLSDDEDVEADTSTHTHLRHHDKVILHFGKDATLPAGEIANAVIAIGGSATSAGEVAEAVVSVFGNTHVTGPTGDNAVAVFGNTYVDSAIGGQAIAIFGDVVLGPDAVVEGDIIAFGGSIERDPSAVIHGDTQEIFLPGQFGKFEWLRPWFQKCLLYGRPLAFEPGLGWAWTVAFGFLTFYILLALIFPGSVSKCVDTLEMHPGQSLLASLLTMLLTPIAIMLMVVTVIGIAAVPFVGIALFFAGLFGKAVVLAVLGRRLTSFIGAGPLSDVAFSVLLGGLIVMGLYVVPILGFVVYKLVGMIGLGIVVYTLILAVRDRQNARLVAAPATAAAAPASAAREAATVIDDPNTGAAASDAAAAQVNPSPASPTSVSSADLPRAGFWIRMGALFIDIVLIGVALSAVRGADEITLPVLAAYGAMMWKLKGATIGGILCRVRVVRVDGREIDWSTAIVRALSCFLSLACAGLGFLWIVFDNGRQSWHDKIAGTAVVRIPRGIAST
jgi:uncharacterized RDD family membrane protein YckC